MKLISILFLVIVVAAAISATLPAQFVEEHETITQLVWNRHEALVVSGMRRDGWRGTYARYAIQFLRGVLGDVPEYKSKREWVVIAHITPHGVQHQIAESTPFPLLRPANGAMFWGNNPLLKWNGHAFVMAPTETETVAMRARSANPSYDKVEGWSSRMNLLNQEDERVEIPLDLDGARVIVIAERTPDRSQKSVKAVFGDGRTEEVVSLSEGHRLVSSTDYQALIPGR
jgi:hypothetical protein